MKTLEKRMKALDKRMMKFGKSLEGRLDARLIESALDYIHYSERFLAFEILCTYYRRFRCPADGTRIPGNFFYQQGI